MLFPVTSTAVHYHFLLSALILIVSGAWAQSVSGETLPASRGWAQHMKAAHDLQNRGNTSKAEKEVAAAVTDAKATLGRNEEFALALGTAGVFYQDIGKFSQAESSLNKSLKIWTEVAGRDDLRLVPVVSRIAWLYVETGHASEVSRLHLVSWIDRLAVSDPRSEYLPALHESLGGMFSLQGKFARAEEEYRTALDLLAARGSLHSPAAASALNNFGLIYARAGRFDQAINCFSQALQLLKQLAGTDDLPVAMAAESLADVYLRVGQYDESGRLFEHAVAIIEQKCGPNSLRTAYALSKYARLLHTLKRNREASGLEFRARQIRAESIADSYLGQTVEVRNLARRRGEP